MKPMYSRVTHQCLRYLAMHLFITIASLPILVAWGIPLSRLSLLGNFFFSPVIFLFLLLSSTLFFSEILHIPHGFIDWLLEKVTAAWQWILPLHGTNTLYGFSTPPLWLLLIIGIAPFLLSVHSALHTTRKRIIALSLLLIIAVMTLELAQKQTARHIKIPCHGSEVMLWQTDDKTVLIDPGCMGKRISAPSWASYTLAPTIIMTTGKTVIDHCIICKPNIMTLQALQELCKTITIRHLYIPYLYGEFSGSIRSAWGRLYHALTPQKTIIHRIYEDKSVYLLDEPIHISLNPHGKKMYKNLSYPIVQIQGFIDGQTVSL